jgi:aryl-alcohol dehydrogenase-like predicted oxidoreductase
MKKRALGPFTVGDIGLGCMNLSHAYGVPPTLAEGRRLLAHALDLGIDHFDTASLYGFGKNEELVGASLKPFRSQITLASKCGMTGIDGKRVIDGRPASLKRDCEDSLRRLGTDVIDLYYLHRWDKQVPIEDSVGSLADLAAAGKIRSIGLSEVSAETLRRAHAIHPIAALQSEYSLWTRNPEIATLRACADLGVTFVAFSPLGRGFLTAVDLDPASFAAGDIRAGMPRFIEPQFQDNQRLLADFRALAAELGTTPACLALAWVLAQGEHIVAIPGTVSIDHLTDDVAASDLILTPEQIDLTSQAIDDSKVSGARYAEQAMREVDTEAASVG